MCHYPELLKLQSFGVLTKLFLAFLPVQISMAFMLPLNNMSINE
jgi:hypothetical protein